MNKKCIRTFCDGKTAAQVMFAGLLLVLVLAVAGMASAQDSTDLRFRGGIGVIPVTGVVNGVATLNIVRGINPAGPWRIADLAAEVSSFGHIRVKGRGLLLAAGNGIGTNARASVFATLFCGPANSATAHSSNRVALGVDGDFRIDDSLLPAPPSTCETPVLLIRNGSGSGVWFAAGIPETD